MDYASAQGEGGSATGSFSGPVALELSYKKCLKQDLEINVIISAAELQEFVTLLNFMQHDHGKEYQREISEFLAKHKVPFFAKDFLSK